MYLYMCEIMDEGTAVFCKKKTFIHNIQLKKNKDL